MFHNFCYTIPVYSPTYELASPSDIYRRLRGVVADVDARIQAGEKAFPIGVLSADDRDIWAKVKIPHLFKFTTNPTDAFPTEPHPPPFSFPNQQILTRKSPHERNGPQP